MTLRKHGVGVRNRGLKGRTQLGIWLSILLIALIAAGLETVSASPEGSVKDDIDICPGLAGQPQGRRDLVTEYITVPALAHPPGTPAILNQANFLRVRRKSVDPNHVDAILIQDVPNGASSFTELAAQIIETAALQGKNYQVWGIERREKNLEDTAGMREAFAKRDPGVALHYYYGDGYLDSNGKFAAKVGGPGAKYVPLTQNDLAFMADWDAEVLNRDVETILDLIPEDQRKTNVFVYSASPGGYFLSQFAGFRLLDGNRGYQELAGLIDVEGALSGDSIGAAYEPTAKDIDEYVAKVEAIRKGTTPRYLDVGVHLLFPGPDVAIPAEIMLMAADFHPEQESIFPIPSGVAGGVAADAFNAKLRLTNRARAGYALSDDPLPGSFTQLFYLSGFGGRMGRLDFTPDAGAPACAEPGPFGMKPPCVPPVSQINPAKVYDWLNGGPGGAGEKGSPLEGWTKDPQGNFSSISVNSGPDPTNVTTAVESLGRPATRTNLVPLTIDFADSGRQVLDASFGVGWAWYPSNRYLSIDVPFISRFKKVFIDRKDAHIHLDIDKSAIDIPIIELTVHLGTYDPWPNNQDFTVVDPDGVTEETPLAAQRSPINPATTMRLYKNIDIHTADNSKGALALKGGEVRPGDVGAQPIPETVVKWITARAGNKGVDIQSFQTRVSCGE